MTTGGLFVLCSGLGAIISNNKRPPIHDDQVRIEEIPLRKDFPKEKPIVVQYDPSNNKGELDVPRKEPKKVKLPELKSPPYVDPPKPSFIGDEQKASDLLTQAKFLRGTNQIDRCKMILNDILTNHTDTKAAIEAKKILMILNK